MTPDTTLLSPTTTTVQSQAGAPTGGAGGDVCLNHPIPGNLYLTTGKGFGQAPAGDFYFQVGGVTILKLGGDGTVTVRGEVVDSNRAIYDAFKAWLESARLEFHTAKDGSAHEGAMTLDGVKL